jgi:hypothetical protein
MIADGNSPIVGTPKSQEHLREKQERILRDFFNKVLSESKPCPAEYVKTVNEHFWELI